MEQKRVLVVEDDPAIRQGIVDALEHEGYSTLQAERADQGLVLVVGGFQRLADRFFTGEHREGFVEQALLIVSGHQEPGLALGVVGGLCDEARSHHLQQFIERFGFGRLGLLGRGAGCGRHPFRRFLCAILRCGKRRKAQDKC